MKNTHTEHCCAIHGCKYGKDDECTVLIEAKNQNYVQSKPCESCWDNGWNTMKKVLEQLHPTIGTFDNHIIIYAKGWYGNSYDGNGSQYIINDIRKLMSIYYEHEEKFIGDKDVKCAILSAFDKYYTMGDRLEALKEAFGWLYGRTDSLMRDREPETVLIGKLSILKGKFIYKPEMIKNICFTRDKANYLVGYTNCQACHRFNATENDHLYCSCVKVVE